MYPTSYDEMMCVNPQCKYHEKKFKIPTIELLEVEEQEDE